MSQPTPDTNDLVVSATVTEALPNAMFRVRVINGAQARAKIANVSNVELPDEFIAYLSGRMKLHRIKVLVGDTVSVLIDSYGGKGRIVKRG